MFRPPLAIVPCHRCAVCRRTFLHWRRRQRFGLATANCALGRRSAGRDWKRYRPSAKIPARIAVYEEAVRVITTFDVRCYIRGANIAGHTARYTADTDIHGTVLPWVLERVQADAKTRRDVALVIADEVARQDRYRADVGDYRKMGTWGWRAQTLDRIADTLHFAPSHASRLLQAADLVSYAHTQSCRHHRDPRATAVWQRIWKALCPSIVKEASCWGG